HTDRSGTDQHNEALSKRRLDATVEALLAAGVSPEALARTHFYGETRPRVPTPDGVRLQDNRRVEIHFLCGRHGGRHHPSGPAQCVSPMRARVGQAAQ
ncbi:MAG: OmpA family protein, partial [Burkholderiales bacterium]